MAPSRFANSPPMVARAILAALALALIATVSATAGLRGQAGSDTGTTAGGDDLVLYRTIVARVAAGQAYYPVAAQELRTEGYPLKPFVAFRLPTLAVAVAAIGQPAAAALLAVLTALTTFAWWRRWRDEGLGHAWLPTLLLFTGTSVGLNPNFALLHEVWAGLFIALAVALYRPDQWLLSFALVALALAIRELTLPVIGLFGFCAWRAGRGKESAAWTLLGLAFGLGLLAHYSAVSAVVQTSDPTSPGWSTFGGSQAYFRALAMTGPFRVFPDPVAQALVLLAMVGWAARASWTGEFVLLLLAGYGLLLSCVGRPENFYWGFMLASLVPVGLAFLPSALQDLVSAASPRKGLA